MTTTRGRYESVVVQADSRCLPLADNTVDLVVTSPPYFALRSYQDGGEHYAGQVGSEPTPAEFVDALVAVTAECVRVLKPSGSIWVNLGDKYGPNKSLGGLPWRYALACIDELGLILRAEVIWSKPNGLPESVTDRVRRSHEQWFHFTVQPRYFAAVDEVREPHAAHTLRYYPPGGGVSKPRPSAAAKRDGGDWHGDGKVEGLVSSHPLGKLPGSVWSIPTQPLRVPEHLRIDHFAAFPMEWPRRIIKGWSPSQGVVLDPFGGTGTTALVASALGRTGVSVDLSHDYSRLAQWRTTDPAQQAKAAQQPKPKMASSKKVAPDAAAHPNQGDLFGDVA